MLRKAARGFTLIELMIVVAIIGILAAIAIPNFLKYQLRTKRSEGSVNVAGIRTAEISYFGANDVYVETSAPLPAAPPGATKAAWTCPEVGGTDANCFGFQHLAWRPEGQVYFSYDVDIDVTANGASFAASAEGDVDGSGATTTSCWVYGKPNTAGTVTAVPDCTVSAGVTAKVDQTYLATTEDLY